MEQLKITNKDFRVRMPEKNKLYNYYGKQYIEELPKIYEKLANILNSDSFFSDLVDKRLHDRNFQELALEELKLYLLIKIFNFDKEKIVQAKTIDEIENREVLEKIKNIYNSSKEYGYFDILYSIVKLLFRDYVNRLLQIYVSNKELALGDCQGLKDIEHCDFIIDRYHKFIESLNVDAKPTVPIIDESGSIVIKKGDLFHGTTYSEKVIESIAVKGLESGQLHGMDEDGETFYCVDFFKAEKDSTADEICTFGKQYTNVKNQIVFVINHVDLNGPNAMFPDLTDYDAYNELTEKGRKVREIVNTAGLPLTHSTGAAILMGVPPCMISSIIVNSDIENNPEKIEFLSFNFPNAFIIGRSNGHIIRCPVESYKR